MWISVKEQIVEERKFELHTSNCTSGEVILQLLRRDVRVSFFLFPKKITQLVCSGTGKKIKKIHWSAQIKKTAEELKRELKVPTWGYWSSGIIALTVLLAVPIGFYSEIKTNQAYQESFMAQNDQQKKAILQKLDTGDLIVTMNKVYKIQTVDPENVVLLESKNPVPESFTEGLTNKAYPKTSFTNIQLEVSKTVFMSGMISNSDMILNVLDN